MASDGEERLLTLYADIHYYFSEPSPRPPNHRFDKESYVYLYGDARTRRGRIEVANHAGTAEQDAFTGYLDNVTIQQSAKHPALCTLTVNGAGNKALPDEHWRLPSTDPRDEGRYLFKLHTLDIYFWTDADALQFIHAASRLLRQEQVESDALPITSPPAHEQPMSPVVQNLENLAVSHDGSTGTRGQQPTAGSTPGPGVTIASPPTSPAHENQGQSFAPMAYNPAAPAAPEKIAHREKTPPPPEGDTGLNAATARDHGHVSPVQPGAQASFGPQATPSFGPSATPSFGPSATPSFGPSATPSFGPGAHSRTGSTGAPTSPPPQAFSPHQQTATPSSFSQPPTTASSVSTPQPMSPSSRTSVPPGQSFPGPPSRGPSEQSLPHATPTHEILGPNFGQPQAPLQHIQPQYPDYLAQRISQNSPPSAGSQGYHAPGSHHNKPHGVPENVRIGGYSGYDYNSPGSQQDAGGYHDANPYQAGNYAIHQQAYRPTEQEAGAHKKNSKQKLDGDARPGKLEAGAERVEKKVNRFLRGLEKRIG